MDWSWLMWMAGGLRGGDKIGGERRERSHVLGDQVYGHFAFPASAFSRGGE